MGATCVRASRRPSAGLLFFGYATLLLLLFSGADAFLDRRGFTQQRSMLWGLRGGSSSVEPIIDHASQLACPTTVQTTALESQQNSSLPSASSNSTDHTIPAWKRKLPDLLTSCQSLHKLIMGDVEIYLLGTAHVSNDSSAHVRMLLNNVEPDAILVELCEARLPMLWDTTTDEASSDAPPPNATIGQKIRELRSQGSSRFQALGTVLLTSVQEDFADSLGVELGGEFKAAYEYWTNRTTMDGGDDDSNSENNNMQISNTKENPCYLILGDRPVQLTLTRAWESLWWWPKVKVICGLVWSSIQKPKPEKIRKWLAEVMAKDSDVLTTSLQEMRKAFPTLYETIIGERDAYLAAKTVQSCRGLQHQEELRSPTAAAATSTTTNKERTRFVVIVGAGHLPGILRWLTNQSAASSPEEILRPLVATKKWATDDQVQNEMIPYWVREVTLVQPAMVPPPPLNPADTTR